MPSQLPSVELIFLAYIAKNAVDLKSASGAGVCVSQREVNEVGFH